jgi:pyruvate dehydrogenase E1 component alpha subunit
VVFVCENNLYSVYTPLSQRQPDRPLTDVAQAHGMFAAHGDGNDFEQTFKLATESVQRARDSEGPTFLLLDTYRWREHCGPSFDNNIGYRTEDEYKQWEARDPIRSLRGRIGDAMNSNLEKSMIAKISTEIEDARAFARSAPLPDASLASQYVYA